jgi:threonine/homoserine/homoserine lactone efflux protein
VTLTNAVLSFAVLAGLLTIIPGLDTLLVLRSAITHGRGPAFATALGISTGALVWGAAAAVGVSALLTASTVAYTVLRIAGAAYMIGLGLRMLWAALRPGADRPRAPTVEPTAASTRWRSWQRGLMTNLLNPKIGAFYVAVLPQFIPAGSAHLAVGLLLATVHDIEGIAWFSALIFGVRVIRGWLTRRSTHRAIDATTGAVVLGFGLNLGLSAR